MSTGKELPADQDEAIRAAVRDRGPVVLTSCFFTGLVFDCDLCGAPAMLEALCGALARTPGTSLCWDCTARFFGDAELVSRIRALLDEYRLRAMPAEGRA